MTSHRYCTQLIIMWHRQVDSSISVWPGLINFYNYSNFKFRLITFWTEDEIWNTLNEIEKTRPYTIRLELQECSLMDRLPNGLSCRSVKRIDRFRTFIGSNWQKRQKHNITNWNFKNNSNAILYTGTKLVLYSILTCIILGK